MRMAFCRFKMGGPWFIPTSSLHKVPREMSTGMKMYCNGLYQVHVLRVDPEVGMISRQKTTLETQ